MFHSIIIGLKHSTSSQPISRLALKLYHLSLHLSTLYIIIIQDNTHGNVFNVMQFNNVFFLKNKPKCLFHFSLTLTHAPFSLARSRSLYLFILPNGSLKSTKHRPTQCKIQNKHIKNTIK